VSSIYSYIDTARSSADKFFELGDRGLVTYTWKGRLYVSLVWDSKYYEWQTFKRIDEKMREYIQAYIA